eukprot:1161928-Pelagomonas_calceolata.AAC.7
MQIATALSAAGPEYPGGTAYSVNPSHPKNVHLLPNWDKLDGLKRGDCSLLLPWPTQRAPRPRTQHAGQANYAEQHCNVKGAGEAMGKML